MELNYLRAQSMIYNVFGKVESATKLLVDPDFTRFDGRFHNSLYHDHEDRIFVGGKALSVGMRTGSMSYVDCVSTCKQALHEYRHWQQRQLFAGRSHNPEDHGLPNLPFGDDIVCRTMARQCLIGAVFPAYQDANQFMLSYERDAEEYAMYASPFVLKAVDFPESLIEPCLVLEINRRIAWYGDQPVNSSADAIADLRKKKCGPQLARLPLTYAPDPLRVVSKSFLNDIEVQEKYQKLNCEDGDRFLIEYIGRRDPKAFNMYSMIKDEMPELRPHEKMVRGVYRVTHGLPDENIYDGPDF